MPKQNNLLNSAETRGLMHLRIYSERIVRKNISSINQDLEVTSSFHSRKHTVSKVVHLTQTNDELACVTKGNVKPDSSNNAVADSFMDLDKFHGLILKTLHQLESVPLITTLILQDCVRGVPICPIHTWAGVWKVQKKPL